MFDVVHSLNDEFYSGSDAVIYVNHGHAVLYINP